MLVLSVIFVAYLLLSAQQGWPNILSSQRECRSNHRNQAGFTARCRPGLITVIG